mmetsp:Transcript_29298/g.73007  ORF Transcript_29298/g.73007 Transcript_29298/m.73007 type:complete len:293 (-) Transcript_29298:6-884(-)
MGWSVRHPKANALALLPLTAAGTPAVAFSPSPSLSPARNTNTSLVPLTWSPPAAAAELDAAGGCCSVARMGARHAAGAAHSASNSSTRRSCVKGYAILTLTDDLERPAAAAACRDMAGAGGGLLALWLTGGGMAEWGNSTALGTLYVCASSSSSSLSSAVASVGCGGAAAAAAAAAGASPSSFPSSLLSPSPSWLLPSSGWLWVSSGTSSSASSSSASGPSLSSSLSVSWVAWGEASWGVSVSACGSGGSSCCVSRRARNGVTGRSLMRRAITLMSSLARCCIVCESAGMAV